MRLLTSLALLLSLGAQGTVLAQQAEPSGGQWVAALRGKVDVEGGIMRLAAQRDGLIEVVLVKEGDKVTQGQLLARINDLSAQLQLRAAELEVEQSQSQRLIASMKLDQAKAEQERLAIMAAADAVPRKEIDAAAQALNLAITEADQARIAVELSQNRLQIAQLEISAREIRAPVAGVILRSSARVGDATTTNTVTEMFLLTPDTDRVLKGMLDEQFVGKVAPGQSADLISERNAEIALQGKVLRIAPIFGTPGQQGQSDTQTSGVEIVLSIDGAGAEQLILGEALIARIKP